VFRRDALAVDDIVVRAQVVAAVRGAFNLALFAAYPAKGVVPPLLALAHSKALALSVEAGYVTKASLPFLLAKAQAHMLALAGRAPDAGDEDLKRRLGGPGGPARPPAEETKETRKEEPKETTEEEAAEGLGALFG